MQTLFWEQAVSSTNWEKVCWLTQVRISYILRGHHEITEKSKLVDYMLKSCCWTWHSDLEQVPQTVPGVLKSLVSLEFKKKKKNEQKCTTLQTEEWFLTEERCHSACFNPASPGWPRSEGFGCFIYKFFLQQTEAVAPAMAGASVKHPKFECKQSVSHWHTHTERGRERERA